MPVRPPWTAAVSEAALHLPAAPGMSATSRWGQVPASPSPVRARPRGFSQAGWSPACPRCDAASPSGPHGLVHRAGPVPAGTRGGASCARHGSSRPTACVRAAPSEFTARHRKIILDAPHWAQGDSAGRSGRLCPQDGRQARVLRVLRGASAGPHSSPPSVSNGAGLPAPVPMGARAGFDEAELGLGRRAPPCCPGEVCSARPPGSFCGCRGPGHPRCPGRA